MTARTATRFRRFAGTEAAGRSPVYADVARRVADDPEILAFLAARPTAQQQPNLLLAAMQYVAGPTTGWAGFRAAFAAHLPRIDAVMAARTTQTNVPARCAVLLPALATLPRPLALLEVGASAGLCLLPDRYGYEYGRVRLPGRPVLRCRASAGTPLPERPVEVAWRAGLDLHPLDVGDADDRAWLHALVWPGEDDRAAELAAALDVAAADPPAVHRGDLRTDLPRLLALAPEDATPVVFHTAVLAYLPDPEEREAFAATVRATGAVWLANESPGALPFATPPGPPGWFALAQDGRHLGWTDPHGAAVRWA